MSTAIAAIVYTLNITVFVILMLWLDYDRSFVQALAKNSAILTASSTGLLVLSIRRTEPDLRPTTWQIIHQSSAITLLIFSIIHSIAHFPSLLQSKPLSVCTGFIMLSILVCAASIPLVRKNHYNCFYMIHIFSFSIFAIAAALHSPVYFVPSIAIYIGCILLQRILTLWKQRMTTHDLRVHHLTESFVILDIHVPRILCCTGVNWSRCKHKHEMTIWLVCTDISYLQRHPFTVFEHEQCWSGSCRLRILIDNNGDWKHELNTLTEQAFCERVSERVLPTIFVDTLRREKYPVKMLKSATVLFILKNVGISSFFAFMYTILLDPRLETNRQIVLHYQCCRYDYLALLAEYLLKHKSLFTIKTTVYMPKYQNMGSHFRGTPFSDFMCIKSDTQLNVNMAIIEAYWIHADIVDKQQQQQQQLNYKQKRPFCYTNECLYRNRVAASALVDTF